MTTLETLLTIAVLSLLVILGIMAIAYSAISNDLNGTLSELRYIKSELSDVKSANERLLWQNALLRARVLGEEKNGGEQG